MKLCKDCEIKERAKNSTYCNTCQNKRGRASYKRNRSGNSELIKRTNLKQKYKITYEQFIEMHEKQGGCCAICKAELPLIKMVVDHNHATNKVRGLLCTTCNFGLGHFKDSQEILSSAIIYLNETV